jgi:hypothetical protein
VWLNALSIEAPSEESNPNRLSEYVKDSLNIPLDFYPLCEFHPVAWDLESHAFSSRFDGQGDYYRGRARSSCEDESSFRNVPPVHKCSYLC